MGGCLAVANKGPSDPEQIVRKACDTLRQNQNQKETQSCKIRKRSSHLLSKRSDETMSSASSQSHFSSDERHCESDTETDAKYHSQSQQSNRGRSETFSESQGVVDQGEELLSCSVERPTMLDKTQSEPIPSPICSPIDQEADPAAIQFRGRLELMRRFYSWKEIPLDFFVDSHVTVENQPTRRAKKCVERSQSEMTRKEADKSANSQTPPPPPPPPPSFLKPNYMQRTLAQPA